jgi:WLM domain
MMADNSSDTLSLPITYRGTVYNLSFPSSATITDLAEEIATSLSVPISNQKLIVSKLGLLKLPFKDPSLPLSCLLDKTISVLGSTNAEVSAVNRAAAEASQRSSRTANSRQKVTANKRHDWAKEQEEAIYTFTDLRPLHYLPSPERSLAFLQRLKDDPGIKATMRKHKWTVPLLTEMNPIEHTQSNHEGTSRTLGLNRNAGEVIELRLRTDAYDGYRDYKTIRKTLCHELAHNVHGPHDRKFWDLCHQIEKEVEGADWRSGGHTVGNQEFYEAEEIDDHGGWHGGEFVLGGEPGGQGQGLSRREILAKAAEERIKKLREQGGSHSESSGGSSG